MTTTMTTKTILSGADFNPNSDIKYSKPKVDARGSKSIGILNAGSNSATYISTPLMLTWGVSDSRVMSVTICHYSFPTGNMLQKILLIS